jgi:signal transduction histidine kinase
MLVLIGLVTWALSGVWLLTRGAGLTWAVVAWVAFVAPFVLVTRTGIKGRAALALVLFQSACAVTMGALSRNVPAATLAIVAGQLPFLLSTRGGLVVLVAQTAAFFAALLALVSLEGAAILCASYASFEAFAFGAAYLAVREQRAREALATVNAELLATQAMLEHSSRELERQRVSRELHDVLGHHLTALSLQLEVAKNLVEGRAVEPVGNAHELAKNALSEVRQVVSSLREQQPFELTGALRKVTATVPGLTVHLDAPAAAQAQSPRAALAVLRFAQEAVTNAARHSGAKNVWLTVKVNGERLTVAARDDGRGAAKVSTGNGLLGLKERLAELGGELAIDTQPGRGFTVTGSIPL